MTLRYWFDRVNSGNFSKVYIFEVQIFFLRGFSMCFHCPKSEIKYGMPRIIKIGVCGPREIDDKVAIQDGVKEILNIIEEKLPHTPHAYVAVSALSEGADLLLSGEIMKFSHKNCVEIPPLNPILQKDEKEHIKLFKKQESIDEFQNYVKDASVIYTVDRILKTDKRVKKQPHVPLAGQLIVDRSDILLVVGVKGNLNPGETKKIADYGFEVGRTIFWIDPENGSHQVDNNTDNALTGLERHDSYNKECLKREDVLKAINTDYSYVEEKFEDMKAPEKLKQVIRDNILFHQVRSDMLAMKYHNGHLLYIYSVFLLSALSVTVVTIYILFWNWPILLLVESVFIGIIIAVLFLNYFKGWHRRWVDYRYLAERLRAALIFSMVGQECSTSKTLPHQSFHNDWTNSAYEFVYLQQLKKIDLNLSIDDIKEFVLKHWIDDQIGFYRKKRDFHASREKFYTCSIYALFLATFIGAFYHGIESFSHETSATFQSNLATLLVIIAPALAASFAGIRNQQEYQRNHIRYSQMILYLNKKYQEIERASSVDELKKIFESINKRMLREHQDWKALFAVHKPEPS